ncbi:MAG: HAD family hydrolase [Clostridia bacterium]|nr:HAD family hydrolase [Clostridia bacterium]
MKGIIFDLDGTLLDTLPDLLRSMNASLSELGYETVDDVKLKSFIGDGARNLVIRCLGGDPTEDETEKLLAVYRRQYSENLTVLTKHFDGVSEMLSSLAKDGIKLAVLSNKPDDQTKKIVKHYFPDIPFVTVRGKTEGAPLKPDPFSALAIAAEMGISPADAVFVGDSPVDFKTARNAGMKCVSVLWGYRTKADFDGLSQSNFAETADELLSLLKTECKF